MTNNYTELLKKKRQTFWQKIFIMYVKQTIHSHNTKSSYKSIKRQLKEKTANHKRNTGG